MDQSNVQESPKRVALIAIVALIVAACIIGITAYLMRNKVGTTANVTKAAPVAAKAETAKAPEVTVTIPVPKLDLTKCKKSDITVKRGADGSSLKFNCPVVLDYSGK